MTNEIRLSPREIQTLELLAADYTIAGIARQWGVSEGYIKNLTYSARRKCSTRSTLAAAVKATILGLLKVSMNQYPFAYVHKKCGGVAFYSKFRVDLAKGCPLSSFDVVMENGEHPRPFTDIKCGRCGERLEEAPVLKE